MTIFNSDNKDLQNQPRPNSAVEQQVLFSACRRQIDFLCHLKCCSDAGNISLICSVSTANDRHLLPAQQLMPNIDGTYQK